LEYDEPLSSFAFSFNLRHHNAADYDILCEKKLERNEELIEALFDSKARVGLCSLTPG